MIAINEKLTENEVTVNLKGGKLDIKYNEEESNVYLKGPAEIVFEGKIEMM